jgi:hypothetical protein
MSSRNSMKKKFMHPTKKLWKKSVCHSLTYRKLKSVHNDALKFRTIHKDRIDYQLSRLYLEVKLIWNHLLFLL